VYIYSAGRFFIAYIVPVYLSKEYAMLLKQAKDNIPADDDRLSLINEAVLEILRAKNQGQVKRIIRFAGEKIRFLKKLDGIR
jgi:hypothetical protein